MEEKILRPIIMFGLFLLFSVVIYFFIPNLFFAIFGSLILLVLVK